MPNENKARYDPEFNYLILTAKIQQIFKPPKKIKKKMKENIKKTTLRYHSSIRVERLSTTWRGRIAQKMRTLSGQAILLPNRSRLPEVYRSLFPAFFRALDSLPYSTKHPTEQMTLSTSYTIKEALVVEGTTTLYHQTETVEQAEWRICPCSDGADLTVSCSNRLAFRLFAGNFLIHR